MGPGGIKGPQYYGVGRVVKNVIIITLEFCESSIKCQCPMLKYSYSNNERYQMSNLMKVPHTVVFEAIIDLDKIPANLLPRLIALNETQLTEMCKEATLHALGMSNVLPLANENNTWAEVTIKGDN